MDIALLRTFLEVYRTRHFGNAAENLFLTQSAISARIRQLEENLGVQLFTRDRNNIQLTPAGARFLKHAESIINAWNRARQEMALEEESKIPVSIGGMYSLWDTLLQDWVHRIYRHFPNIALQAEAHGSDAMIRRLLDSVLDVGFMFEAPQVTELLVEEIGTLPLIMVATRKGLNTEQAIREMNYIMVDWGTAFANVHARYFPDMPAPSIRMGLGRMALAFLLECGGVAYLAEPMAAPYLKDQHLFPVHEAPVIDRKVYAVYPHSSTRIEMVEKMLEFIQT